MEGKKRILTRIRPTGPLHLGHYAGALENWVSLQTSYDCYFLIADYQCPTTLTTLRGCGRRCGRWRSTGLQSDSIQSVAPSLSRA